MKKVELLVPASNLEVLKTAVIYGADAVYIGGEAYGLRAKAKNFSLDDMREGIAFAHERGVKVYVTANILAHNYDLDGARSYFKELKEIKPDALIISDPGMFTIAKEECPEIEIHISTQANNTNYMTYLFWHKMGAARVVSARELSIPIGTLTGSALLAGRGPRISVRMESVGSSSARFENRFDSAGINQTNHQIALEVDVSVSILLPGFTTATTVSTAVTVAETVIVGSVPETYTYFSTTPDTYEEDLKDYILNNS